MAIVALPGWRRFFELAVPNAAALVMIIVGSAIAIGFLWLTDDRFVPLRGAAGDQPPGTMEAWQ
jgi:hypothetical protein